MQLLTLGRANAYHLQDAWHYAMLLVKRGDSTFDGCSDYPRGIIGQVLAYEKLLRELDAMTADCETWELVHVRWSEPQTVEEMVSYAKEALEAINQAAARLGIDARTAEKPEKL